MKVNAKGYDENAKNLFFEPGMDGPCWWAMSAVKKKKGTAVSGSVRNFLKRVFGTQVVTKNIKGRRWWVWSFFDPNNDVTVYALATHDDVIWHWSGDNLGAAAMLLGQICGVMDKA